MADAHPKMTALIVEDDRGVGELGALMLREFDLHVVRVENAEDAIDHLQRHGDTITIVLADVNLPGEMDGVSLARSIAVLWPGISLIVTSGDPGDRLASLPASAVYVPKPWRALDLVAAAERASREDHSVHAIRL